LSNFVAEGGGNNGGGVVGLGTKKGGVKLKGCGLV